MITPERKKEVIAEYATKEGDTGSPEVQVAVLSERITNLTEHFKTHAKDNHSRRGLIKLVSTRRRLLDYIKSTDEKRYDALIAIGCVLRGETTHYDYVCSETARGLQLAQMDSGLPIIFCVLTCDTLEQAIDRAGLKGGNKGFEAGLAAIEMAQLSRKLRAAKAGSGATGKSRRK